MVVAVSKIMVFAGNSNTGLVQKVVNHLDITQGKAYVGRYSDGEVAVEILENVREKMSSLFNQPVLQQMIT